jgi:CPA2 family monovalent cation:H+ antiporter-2
VYAKSLATEKHVVICGYGRCGQNLARFLEQENIPYIALDLDPERVREATAAGESVVYGDGSRLEMLKAAGLNRASAVVITHTETANALKTLHHVRQLNPNIPTVVRTYDDSDLEKLQAAGAAEVVPEILEGSLMLASHALVLLGVPLNRVLRRVQTARDERYTMLRGYFSGLDVTDDLDHQNIQLHSVSVHTNAIAVGATIAHLNLSEIGVEVVALRRKDIRATEILPETLIEANDVLVLRGQLDAVLKAEERLLQPSKVHFTEAPDV